MSKSGPETLPLLLRNASAALREYESGGAKSNLSPQFSFDGLESGARERESFFPDSERISNVWTAQPDSKFVITPILMLH